MEPKKFNEICDRLCMVKRRQTSSEPRRSDQEPWESSLRLYARPSAEPCPDCDRTVEGRVVHYWQLMNRRGGPDTGRWAKKCRNCGEKTLYYPGKNK